MWPIPIDPLDPPADATETERLIYEGRCPECLEIANVLIEGEDDTTTCAHCGFQYLGLPIDHSTYEVRDNLRREVREIVRPGRPDRVPTGRRPPAVSPGRPPPPGRD